MTEASTKRPLLKKKNRKKKKKKNIKKQTDPKVWQSRTGKALALAGFLYVLGDKPNAVDYRPADYMEQECIASLFQEAAILRTDSGVEKRVSSDEINTCIQKKVNAKKLRKPFEKAARAGSIISGVLAAIFGASWGYNVRKSSDKNISPPESPSTPAP